MTVLVSALLPTLVFTFMLVMSLWMLIDHRGLSDRPVERLARAFREARPAACVTLAPSLFGLSPEMIRELAAAHGLRYDGERVVRMRLLMMFSPAAPRPEGDGDDR